MNFKSLISLLILLFIISACGKSSGTGASGNSPNSNPVECITFLNQDSIVEIAVKSHMARINCNMSEDEILAILKAD